MRPLQAASCTDLDWIVACTVEDPTGPLGVNTRDQAELLSFRV